MKSLVALMFVLPTSQASNVATPTPNPAHFVSAVQLAVRESGPELTERSKTLIIERFSDNFQSTPEFQNQHYELRRHGNEIAFVMTSRHDMRPSVQRLVGDMIQQLNGKVRAQGRTSFFRTGLTHSSDGFLEVVTDFNRTKIVSVSAQSVPLRELLKEIRMQIGNFSYLVPGECADRLVDFSFGNPTDPKTVDMVMTEVATLFGLKVDKKNNTYIFTGVCHSKLLEAAKNNFITSPHNSLGMRAIQVYLPVSPIGE